MWAEAFSPSHITGFFEIRDSHPQPLMNGSRGAGVCLSNGVYTLVRAKLASRPQTSVRINGRAELEAPVSRRVVELFRSLVEGCYSISIEHYVIAPIGAGFGTSGAAALGLSLALNKALEAGLSDYQVASIAHRAELDCRTGLGTVVAEAAGGLVLRLREGAPGLSVTRKVVLPDSYHLVAGYFGPLSTPEALSNPAIRQRVNGAGTWMLRKIQVRPEPSSFLALSSHFTKSVGLVTRRVKGALDALARAGFTGAMAMFGEVVFTIVKDREAAEAARTLERAPTPPLQVMISQLAMRGAHLL